MTDPVTNKGFTGILIDLDLAKKVGSGPSGARHQTGTVKFMAIQVLQNWLIRTGLILSPSSTFFSGSVRADHGK